MNFTDLKKGTVFEMNDSPFLVIEYTHKTIGRGGANVTVRVKNLLNGKLQSISFKGSEQIEKVNISRSNLQYLYADSQKLYFMDPDSYEQFSLDINSQDTKNFLKEGATISGLFIDGNFVNIELPKNVALNVIQAEDAIRGDTSTAVTKNVTLETGLVARAPSFIKVGDVISIDTTTGAYRERVKA